MALANTGLFASRHTTTQCLWVATQFESENIFKIVCNQSESLKEQWVNLKDITIYFY